MPGRGHIAKMDFQTINLKKAEIENHQNYANFVTRSYGFPELISAVMFSPNQKNDTFALIS